MFKLSLTPGPFESMVEISRKITIYDNPKKLDSEPKMSCFGISYLAATFHICTPHEIRHASVYIPPTIQQHQRWCTPHESTRFKSYCWGACNMGTSVAELCCNTAMATLTSPVKTTYHTHLSGVKFLVHSTTLV